LLQKLTCEIAKRNLKTTIMSTLTLKIEGLYAACSPELGVVSYGRCRDEALNNLTDQLTVQTANQAEGEGTGYEKESHVLS
jgi:hypothetical protein